MSEETKFPLVSVIIPSYNASAYIDHAVSSALASLGVVVEVIVVDDGSSDDTWERLGRFGSRITRVRQERGGAYRARNLGASLARGEWLAFLDADDDWRPEKLQSQLAIADEGTDFVYTDRLNFGDLSRVKERQSDSVTLWEGDVFEHLLMGNFITLSSVMMRKEAFERIGGFAVERRGVQDWDMWLRYAALGGKIRLCREPLTRYRIHTEQMSNDLGQRVVDREAVLRLALGSPRGRQVSVRTARKAYASIWELAAWHASAERPLHTIGYHLRAIYYWPWNLHSYKGILKCCVGRA